MTTLAQIGFTTLGGSSILLLTLCLFGCAVRVRSPLIAPRATARPPSVIYSRYGDRGSAWCGWIIWSLRLSYDTLLQGIPGTGTREAGLSGSLLRVNLDGIVLLRFHAVCLRVASVATVLFVTLLVPAFLSAQCYKPEDYDNATGICDENTLYNLTDYERTTIKNVPSITGSERWTDTVFEQQDGILWRLYATVVCFAIVAAYLCHQLQQEWIQILAMRRVYYLEYDIWGERREELKQTMLFDDYNRGKKKNPERHLVDRDPWIPHPEQRETVPNIALYSILVGGLPSLPEQAADSFNAEATIQFSKRESIDWQLSLTTTFFDHCVPNQPGFSSSIAAVTIIPSAQDLSVAWRKWYAAASKLRRLRFIRHQISLKRHYDIEEAVSELGEEVVLDDVNKYGYGDEAAEIDYGYGDTMVENGPSQGRSPMPADMTQTSLDYGDDLEFGDPPLSISTSYDDSPDVIVSKQVDFGYGTAVPDNAAAADLGYETAIPDNAAVSEAPGIPNVPTPRDIYSASKNKNYFQQVLGVENDDDHHNIYTSRDFGPEQAAVYAREFAQAAAPCCPVGCMEGRIRRARIDQLLEMERITAIEVHEANLDLRAARRRATRADTVFPQRQASVLHAHSCIQVGARDSDDDDDEKDDEDDYIPALSLQAKQNKLLSRYNRKASMDNFKESDKVKREERLNQLENVAPSDLGLEAKLYKSIKTTGATGTTPPATNGNRKRNPSMNGANTAPSVPRLTSSNSLRSKQSFRSKPSLDGIEYPVNMTTEAHLTLDSSDGSASGSANRVKPVLTTASRLSNIKERDSADDMDHVPDESGSSAHWAQVETIITEANDRENQTHPVPDGQWRLPNFQDVRNFFSIKEKGKEIGKWAQQQSMDAVDNLARESTYAVVTFTSRQAAVAARSCLADGRGAGRWQTLKEIPIPPLSDAAPADLVTFRNCCRPVTLSINERQKNVRHYL